MTTATEAQPTATTVRTGRMRAVQSTGQPRPDGLVPVWAAVTMSPATRLSRCLLVPQEAVHRLRLGTPFLWTLTDGEAVVLAVGAADVTELAAALAGRDGDA